MTVLSDPARSEAVLVGVHDYVDLEDLPAVARNLEGLRQALTDPEVWGLPGEACTVIAQPGSAAQVLDTVRERARRARDTLLVYYAGHGLTDPHTDELYLALPDSDREREYTSLRYEYLRRAVLDVRASAQRTVVILDCCYSGRALLGSMSAGVHIADQAIVDGTCLLTASAETRSALSPPGEKYTAFTGELITTLTEGIPGKPDPLDMDTLYRHLHRKLASKSRPLPQQRSRNTGGLIGIARNRAVAARGVRPGSPSTRESDEAGAASREWETARRLSAAVAASAPPGFKPFWFAVPATRQFFSEDGSGPVAELAPGVWYLAVEQRGEAILAQTQGGQRGFLLDTRRIQRGDSDQVEDIAAAEDFESGFEPFWFAVPATRLLFSVDGSGPASELAPGIWYLAVGQRGESIVAQTSDGGRRGLLHDTRGIQRG